LNRPAATKAPLQPIVSGRAWEIVHLDLIDMRHEPSGQYKWILHVKDHFSKYTQLYALKSKHAEPIAEAFAQFIAAFLLLRLYKPIMERNLKEPCLFYYESMEFKWSMELLGHHRHKA
jgi:hypothetical protein